MYLPIEYLLRNDHIRKFIEYPCSLFLASRQDKLIIVLNKIKNKISVKKFRPSIHENLALPSCVESLISIDEVFIHPDVIIPGYSIRPFLPGPNTADKQIADMPHASIQESAYLTCLERFYNPKLNRAARTNWLWRVFCEYNQIPKSSMRVEAERTIALKESKVLAGRWQQWVEQMLYNNQFVAVELIFAKSYGYSLIEL